MLIINNVSLLNEFRGLFSNFWIHVFIWVVVLDIGSGIVKGFITKEANSTKGLTGVVKHLLVVILVMTAVPYLNIAGFKSVSNWFILFYIAVYGISLAENLGVMGIPIPAYVKDMLLKLKDTTNKEKKE